MCEEIKKAREIYENKEIFDENEEVIDKNEIEFKPLIINEEITADRTTTWMK